MNVQKFNRDVKLVTGENDKRIELMLKGLVIATINDNEDEEIYAESTGTRGVAEISAQGVTFWADEYELYGD